MPQTFELTDGPDKPALQWAVAYPERERVQLRGPGEVFDAEVRSMEETGGGGMGFRLLGLIRSGRFDGRPFEAAYDLGTRSGILDIVD